MNISLNETVVQAAGNLASNMNGETVMMRIESGKYYNLGEIGGRIWSLIETPITVEALVAELIQEYEVAAAECEPQVIAFLENLAKEQLILVVQAAS
ncbi:lasso peptide biosynthesis PqqD family chaperone [Paenibacillus kobensis]|uniref:lasso peptide biosynthesis PqqD family chaperone n=1 Tax=Paenibacillus kobensis TaxID=59841 RepID=UPI000FDB4C93|nr:lasso peptide biosynthesis PqqD family chaperone [Paenibacillus kobensis]